MKAVVYEAYGTPDVLTLREVRTPAPKDDEVLIKVHAASVNSWDWDLLRGEPFLNRLGALRTPKYPVLGADVAGRVEAVGKAVRRFAPGDEVFGDISGCGWGGFAEYVCAREDALTAKPPVMTFEEAAALPQAAVLALQGFRDKGRIREGQQVLINGAGGGVGTFAVQLAKWYGAEVTGVDRAEKLETLRSIGADHVLDYAEEDFTRTGRRYDLILDVVGQRSAFDVSRALHPKGAYVMIGGSTARLFQVMLLGPSFSLFGGKRLGLLIHKPNAADQQFMRELVEAGRVAPVIDRLYPLSEVPEALRYFGEGRPKGKVVIQV